VSGFEATPAQVRECAEHLLWATRTLDAAFVECSCGWRWETDFDDHVALVDIEQRGRHARYVIAYPETGDHFASMIVRHDGDELALAPADLEWLLAQPDVPVPFRRAAAVHLQPPA
jgi:hypothetical protein